MHKLIHLYILVVPVTFGHCQHKKVSKGASKHNEKKRRLLVGLNECLPTDGMPHFMICHKAFASSISHDCAFHSCYDSIYGVIYFLGRDGYLPSPSCQNCTFIQKVCKVCPTEPRCPHGNHLKLPLPQTFLRIQNLRLKRKGHQLLQRSPWQARQQIPNS